MPVYQEADSRQAQRGFNHAVIYHVAIVAIRDALHRALQFLTHKLLPFLFIGSKLHAQGVQGGIPEPQSAYIAGRRATQMVKAVKQARLRWVHEGCMEKPLTLRSVPV